MNLATFFFRTARAMPKRPWKGKKGRHGGGRKKQRADDGTHLRRFSQIKADAATRPESQNFEERAAGEKALRQIYNDDGTVTDTPRIGKTKVVSLRSELWTPSQRQERFGGGRRRGLEARHKSKLTETSLMSRR